MEKRLGMFDVINLVVGAIVGADIYVAASFGTGLLGPASILLWAVAGGIAFILALSFARCAMLVPKVGGAYAYATVAFGRFPGFMVGWSMWLAEWTSLAVFPIAFARYLAILIPGLSPTGIVAAKILLVIFLTYTNYLGVKAAGRINDFLTITKLAPLVLFAVTGLAAIILEPRFLTGHFANFVPRGWSHFGEALVMVFWAYAGFELATIPAGEVADASRTIPRALFRGMLIVTFFYLVTNFVLLGLLPWQEVARSTTPLSAGFASAARLLFPALVGPASLVMAVGAIISVAGSDESGTLETSRLAYAMALDGHLPAVFARTHPRHGTPYVSLLFQNTTALAAALLGTIGFLIKAAVLFLGLVYLVTCLAALRLNRSASAVPAGWERYTPYLGITASVYLLAQTTLKTALSASLLLSLGLLIYFFLSPGKVLDDKKTQLVQERRVHFMSASHSETFLAHALQHVRGWLRRSSESGNKT